MRVLRASARFVKALALVATVGVTFCATLATFGCKGTKRDAVPVSELEIGASPRIITGPVGIGIKEKPATYVLVDLTNRGDKGAVVTLGGELLDAADEPLGELRSETIRVPAGATRLFALVDKKVEVLETTAQTTRAWVVRATRPEKPAGVVVTNMTQHEDQGRAVVEGYIENRVNGSVKVIIHGAFYDAEGRPVMRQSTLYNLDAGGKRSAQFIGPKGSAKATLFIGDIGR